MFIRMLQIHVSAAFMERNVQCCQLVIVHLWSVEATYKKVMKITQSLKVVNDAADRFIVQVIIFNLSLTRRQDEK